MGQSGFVVKKTESASIAKLFRTSGLHLPHFRLRDWCGMWRPPDYLPRLAEHVDW